MNGYRGRRSFGNLLAVTVGVLLAAPPAAPAQQGRTGQAQQQQMTMQMQQQMQRYVHQCTETIQRMDRIGERARAMEQMREQDRMMDQEMLREMEQLREHMSNAAGQMEEGLRLMERIRNRVHQD